MTDFWKSMICISLAMGLDRDDPQSVFDFICIAAGWVWLISGVYLALRGFVQRIAK